MSFYRSTLPRRPLKPAIDQLPGTSSGDLSMDEQKDLSEELDSGGEEDPDLLTPTTPTSTKKRKAAKQPAPASAAGPSTGKRPRTNTPWTAAEELRLKSMREAGNSWSEIAKTFPTRTEGSVKKHWYKDMHYAEFGEDEVVPSSQGGPTTDALISVDQSAALLAAIKEYDANKWKVIGQKVKKPAKACEQYAKEHFSGK